MELLTKEELTAIELLKTKMLELNRLRSQQGNRCSTEDDIIRRSMDEICTINSVRMSLPELISLSPGSERYTGLDMQEGF